jgi:hypothetical protein
MLNTSNTNKLIPKTLGSELMASLFWALGAAIILILFIIFLPLGFTIKGKVTIAFVSFILSLGGLSAVPIFPLWQTSLMLVALVFFVAYFMNNRLETLIFKENPAFVEVFDEEFESQEPVFEIETLKDNNLVKLNEELALPDSSIINLDKNTLSELSPSLVISGIEDITDNEQEAIDEDISFLLERNTEVDVNDQLAEKNMENDYLSDIESLLESESKTEQEDLLEEIHDLSPILVEDKFLTEYDEEEDKPLDDALFDFLLAKKEVAVEREEIIDVIKPKEKVSVQK